MIRSGSVVPARASRWPPEGTVSLRGFYLTSAPVVALALVLISGGVPWPLVLRLVIIGSGVAVVSAAASVVGHRRQAGVWDLRRWRAPRQPGSSEHRLRLWPPGDRESLRSQWSRSRWPRYVELRAAVVTLLEDGTYGDVVRSIAASDPDLA
jgi:hypothetical protein